MSISSALLNKRSTATDDGRTVLYSKNISLTDGYRCNISSDLSLLAHGLAPRQCPKIGSITAWKLSIAIIMFDFTLCSTKSELSYVCFLCLRHRRMQNTPYHVCLVALTLYMLMKFKKIEIAAILRWTSWNIHEEWFWGFQKMKISKIMTKKILKIKIKIIYMKWFEIKIKIVILIWNHDLKSHDFNYYPSLVVYHYKPLLQTCIIRHTLMNRISVVTSILWNLWILWIWLFHLFQPSYHNALILLCALQRWHQRVTSLFGRVRGRAFWLSLKSG